MIRVTERQLGLLEHNAGERSGPRTAREKRQLPENQLEKQICDYLGWRGFITTRQHVGLFIPFRLRGSHAAIRNVITVGVEGCSDWWSARPVIDPGGRACDGPWPWKGFFWEAKAPGKKPSDAQLAWLERHRLAGFEAAWFDQFEGSTEARTPRDSHVFLTWFHDYFSSSKTAICGIQKGEHTIDER